MNICSSTKYILLPLLVIASFISSCSQRESSLIDTSDPRALAVGQQAARIMLDAELEFDEAESKANSEATAISLASSIASGNATSTAQHASVLDAQTRQALDVLATATRESIVATASRRVQDENFRGTATAQHLEMERYSYVATRQNIELMVAVDEKRAGQRVLFYSILSVGSVVCLVLIFLCFVYLLLRSVPVILNKYRFITKGDNHLFVSENGQSASILNLSTSVAPYATLGAGGEVSMSSYLNEENQAIIQELFWRMALANGLVNSDQVESMPALSSVMNASESVPSELVPSPIIQLPPSISGIVTADQVINQSDLSSGKILLGLDSDGSPLTVTVKQLCHVAVAGATQQGKTAICMLLLGQLLALNMVDVVICDPHYADVDPESGADWRPIRDRCKFDPAYSNDQINNVMLWLNNLIDRRLEERRQYGDTGSVDWRPVVVYWDELPLINQNVPIAIKVITRLLQEGAKLQIFAICSAQSFLLNSIKLPNSDVRECFLTCFYVGRDGGTGKKLLGVTEFSETNLGRGVAMLRSRATASPQVVKVPYMNNDALKKLLPSDAYNVLQSNFQNQLPEAEAEVGEGTHTRLGSSEVVVGSSENVIDQGQNVIDQVVPPSPTDPIEERVRLMYLSGKSPHRIVVDIWGTRGGNKYQRMKANVDRIIKDLQGVSNDVE